ncbi:MAG: LD-carboxypeptidase [Proteobacteria bacterium]|nr:LD-carboxypeptidase [Pseudomonadota bacterium]
MTIRPPRLKEGDRIGVIAPAGPVDRPEILPGIALLESFGFEVFESPHLFERQGYLAGDDQSRLNDLHAMYRDERVKAILCARGGFGTLRLIDRIDFDLIRENPKITVGYSDITALLLAIHKKTALITFHGPNLRDLGRNENRNLEALLKLVSFGGSMNLDFSEGREIRGGRATGTLLGGNLSLICHLVGTPYLPSLQGALLFIEERGESLYRIDRMISHLKLSGLLDGCVGLMAGSFEECGDLSSIELLLEESLSDLDIPMVGGLQVGHGKENIPLPMGVQASLDTARMTLSITEACVGP